MNLILIYILVVLVLLALLVVGTIATGRIVLPAIKQTALLWFNTREWKPRECLKSQMFTIANKLGPTPR